MAVYLIKQLKEIPAEGVLVSARTQAQAINRALNGVFGAPKSLNANEAVEAMQKGLAYLEVKEDEAEEVVEETNNREPVPASEVLEEAAPAPEMVSDPLPEPVAKPKAAKPDPGASIKPDPVQALPQQMAPGNQQGF